MKQEWEVNFTKEKIFAATTRFKEVNKPNEHPVLGSINLPNMLLQSKRARKADKIRMILILEGED
jgi:hypothetical protein